MIALGDHGPWYAVAAKSQATPQYTPANALSFYRREPASDALMNKPESKILYYAGPQEPTRTAAAMKPDPLSNLAPIVIGAVLIGLLASCAPPFLFANAGVSLAEAGTSAFVEGELRAAKKIPLDVADRAFTQALSNLRFEIERRVEGDGFVYITADQVGDDDIQVRLTSRSPAVTSIKISVGLFGNLTISRLVMEEALEVMRHWENTNDPRGMSQAGAATPSGDPTSASGTPIDPGT